MIKNQHPEFYKNIQKISIINSKDVLYNLQSVLQRKNIFFDEDAALVIRPLPEDIRYPSSSKMTDGGMILSYKIAISIIEQSVETEKKLEKLQNKRVIMVLHYNNSGRMIIGCNENPLTFLYEDDNTINPSSNNGFNIECIGNTYFTKVNQ